MFTVVWAVAERGLVHIKVIVAQNNVTNSSGPSHCINRITWILYQYIRCWKTASVGNCIDSEFEQEWKWQQIFSNSFCDFCIPHWPWHSLTSDMYLQRKVQIYCSIANEHYRYHCIQTLTVHPLYFISFSSTQKMFSIKMYNSIRFTFYAAYKLFVHWAVFEKMNKFDMSFMWSELIHKYATHISVDSNAKFNQKPNKRNKSHQVLNIWMDGQT